jgi:type IV pilus assembly protein PilB
MEEKDNLPSNDKEDIKQETETKENIIGEESLLKEKSLEEILIERGQLESAKQEAKDTGKPLKDILIESGFISKEHTHLLLGIELGVKTIDLSNVIIEPEVANILSETTVRRLKVIPLFKEGETLAVAMADPTDINVIDELHRETGFTIEPVLASEMDISRAIDQIYGTANTIYDIVKSIDEKKLLSSKEAGEEAPIIKLTNLLIVQAVRDRASDIHVEPEEKMLRVRYRVDGVLHRISSLPKFLQLPVVSRIKIMSDLDIAERRLPQDGRIKMDVGNKSIDLRVSIQPTLHGENVVMRILDKASIMIGIENLGLAERDFETFVELIHKPYGMLLVTGPTGSGKTTTLYSALNRLNTEDKNIMTMEDPIEYQLPLVRQTQVNPQIGLTFASGLRAILRQDPDIIMVGEIRDLETAEIAIHSALTGHLVFSTLHTNDAPGAFARLIDMGAEPFLVSSSVIGVVAQRLVRVICERCKQPYKPNKSLLQEMGFEKYYSEDLRFYKGKGCNLCKGTGYRGRLGIFSLLKVTPSVQELVLKKASSQVIDTQARKEGMRTLRDDCFEKVMNGITTIEEMFRVTQDIIA